MGTCWGAGIGLMTFVVGMMSLFVGLEGLLFIGLGVGLGLADRIWRGGGEGGQSWVGEVRPWWGGERGRGMEGDADSSERPCENFPGFCPRTIKHGEILEKMK